MEVTFTREGCFSDERYEFHFTRDQALDVRIFRIDPPVGTPDAKAGEGGKWDLGKITLLPAEAAGLDRLFAHYRSITEGGCSTIDRINLTLKSGGKVVATENFTDATCATSQVKDLVGLLAIAAKVDPR